MMKMSGGVLSCCAALFFALTSVSAVQKLSSITALKKVDFGQSVPKHSLVLLHWFANTVYIDNNNVIWLTFDPNRDYGSHYYHNSEEVLDPLPYGNRYRYYTVGNLHQESSTPLPPHVVRPPREYVGQNRDRIIFRVWEQNTGRRALQSLDEVYITQHYDASENQGTRYDPVHTYRITINLLRQIREFSVGDNQQQLLQLRNRFGSNADDVHIRNTWGDLACLGLLLFIVIQEKHSSTQRNKRHENRQNNLSNGASGRVSPVAQKKQSSKKHNKQHENIQRNWSHGAWETERNVPRGFGNQGSVVVDIYDDEYYEVSRRTGNRVSGSNITSEPQNNCCRSFCCICCCICSIAICLMALGITLFFLYKKR